MIKPTRQQQLSLFTLGIGILSVSSLIYVAAFSPDYLRQSREGTPYFTPPVVNPDGGDPIEVDELIRHYKNQG